MDTLEGLLEKGREQSRKRVGEEGGVGGVGEGEVIETGRIEDKEDEDETEDEDEDKEPQTQPQQPQQPQPQPQPQQQQQQQHQSVSTPLNYQGFLQALTRWSSLKHSPEQVVREVDSLLSLLSPSILSPMGSYVAVNVTSFKQNRLVGMRLGGRSF